ncbi:hypothetical protein ETD83_40895 [Actinomadura soli]|uniref:Nucleotidyltransferase AbiEii toxin of type IV toxin-antitoxin system n=1 Tax=Actinomadura soli TaxID=2508997 RepID=A0A5C4IYD0_9ACTN|nr:hypothetical protein [Actinomadura soli]TMQ84370.1 hypothetical protein ETD83_40895 [Actinomadura soli]
MIESIGKLLAVVSELDLPVDDFLIAGSAPLLVHGLRDQIQDLDLVARGSAWEKIVRTHSPIKAPFDDALKVDWRFEDTSIEVLNCWFPARFGWTVDYLISSADVIEGVNFMSLQLTLIWKNYLSRDKDTADVSIIRRYLSTSRS